MSANSILGVRGGRSGSLNKLDLNLTFPDDLGETKNDNGIIHWVEFTTYFKPNGSLSSIINDVANSITSTLSGIGEQVAEGAKEAKEAVADLVLAAAAAEPETAEILNDEQTPKPTVTRSSGRLASATNQPMDVGRIYLPGGIQFTDQINYSDVGFAGIRNLSDASAFTSVSRINFLRKLGGVADKAASFVGQESLNTGPGISARLGVVVNPRKEQMFQGVSFRSFDFKFNLFPRTKKEAETAANLIKMFRFHAYPELSANGAFLNFPSEFGIKFMSFDFTDAENPSFPVENKNLPKLHRCFLEKIDTNYTPDEIYRSFADGSPIRVEISLSFKESQYVTRNDVKGGY